MEHKIINDYIDNAFKSIRYYNQYNKNINIHHNINNNQDNKYYQFSIDSININDDEVSINEDNFVSTNNKYDTDENMKYELSTNANTNANSRSGTTNTISTNDDNINNDDCSDDCSDDEDNFGDKRFGNFNDYLKNQNKYANIEIEIDDKDIIDKNINNDNIININNDIEPIKETKKYLKEKSNDNKLNYESYLDISMISLNESEDKQSSNNMRSLTTNFTTTNKRSYTNYVNDYNKYKFYKYCKDFIKNNSSDKHEIKKPRLIFRYD